MNLQITVPVWTILIAPIASLLGTIMAIMLAAFFQNRTLEAKFDTLRAEMKQSIAELKLEILKEVVEIRSRVERLEEQRGLIQR
jgi:hypothetical protein